MSDTAIEYLDKAWNFYTGCQNWQNGVCPIGEKCWAKAIDKRFHRSFEPTLHTDKLLEPLKIRKPSRIGVCFTGDLFGEWVDPNQPLNIEGYPFKHLSGFVKAMCKERNQHQFIFLTKVPNNYKKWGKFPDNAWLGSSVCNTKMMARTLNGFADAQAKNLWISFEPLMERIPMNQFPLKGKDFNISWIVIGGWSRSKTQPKLEWIEEIVNAADRNKIPVFLKNNLWNSVCIYEGEQGFLFNNKGLMRQELPKEQKHAR